MKKKTSNRLDNLFYLIIFLVLVLAIINIRTISNRFDKVEEAQEILKEKMRAARLDVKILIAEDCAECYDINLILDELKKQNVNITSETTLSGNEFIGNYDLEKLPALLVTGEINKSDQLIKFFNDNGKIIDNGTALLTNIKAPYYLVDSGEIVGLVSVTNLVDTLCSNCTSLLPLIDQLKESGVKVISEKTFEYNSTEGLEFIEANEINAIPALIISDQIDYYEELKSALEDSGIEEKKDGYVVHAIAPPYRNLTENKIVGLVDLIEIGDESCEVCYDVNQNKVIVERFGVVIANAFSYDINSDDAQDLIKKYNITKVPMILLSPDASAYPALSQAWDSVGVVEDDEWLVMTKPEILGTYKDLTTGKVMVQQDEQ